MFSFSSVHFFLLSKVSVIYAISWGKKLNQKIHVPVKFVPYFIKSRNMNALGAQVWFDCIYIQYRILDNCIIVLCSNVVRHAEWQNNKPEYCRKLVMKGAMQRCSIIDQSTHCSVLQLCSNIIEQSAIVLHLYSNVAI